MKNEKVTQLVLRLIKLTSHNEIKWEPSNVYSPELPNGEIVLDKMYTTHLTNGRFRIYRYKFKVWVDEDRFEWSQRIRLELIDKGNFTEYEFVYENSMNDLYDIVREQASNVSSILDEILGLGLDILEARYYTSVKTSDVTELVREKIENNKLAILASNDIFGDPHPGVVKKLLIKYKYAGETLTKEVGEGETLRIP